MRPLGWRRGATTACRNRLVATPHVPQVRCSPSISVLRRRARRLRVRRLPSIEVRVVAPSPAMPVPTVQGMLHREAGLLEYLSPASSVGFRGGRPKTGQQFGPVFGDNQPLRTYRKS
jgi:hypothetical protein